MPEPLSSVDETEIEALSQEDGTTCGWIGTYERPCASARPVVLKGLWDTSAPPVVLGLKRPGAPYLRAQVRGRSDRYDTNLSVRTEVLRAELGRTNRWN